MIARFATLSLSIVVGLFLAAAQAAPAMGRDVVDFRLPDHLGKEHALADFADRDLVVVAFLGTECPLAKLYAGRLQTIADEYAERGVAVVAVMSNSQDSLADIAAFVRQHKIAYPVLKDRRNEVADRFGAERTPQVFLARPPARGPLRGRVDDQYLVGMVRDKPTHEDLRQAIDELLQGKAVSVPKTDSAGCIIGRAHEPNERQPDYVQPRYRPDLASAVRAMPSGRRDWAV